MNSKGKREEKPWGLSHSKGGGTVPVGIAFQTAVPNPSLGLPMDTLSNNTVDKRS